ncbi:MAG TPA: gamma-glutamylcyclotransferase family protein [Tepidisphaeraceae bacterium]|jgi:gamma-glutamylcyclotransferase (GGCT)/AIG2-like uncharacterized protein YtfP
MNDLLFAYGTLIPGCEPAAMRSACSALEVLQDATVTGTLYDLGRFPGVVLGEGLVRGTLLRVPSDLWTVLDRYEACPGPDCEDGLFSRVRTQATLADRSLIDCWIYVYNRSLASAAVVASGSWRDRAKVEVTTRAVSLSAQPQNA